MKNLWRSRLLLTGSSLLLSISLVISFGAQQISAQNEVENGSNPQWITPARLSDSFAQVAKKVGPAVVSIDAKSRPAEQTARGEKPSCGRE